MKFLLRLLLRLLFGFRAHNTEVLRAKGPMLLLPNHLSWIDWLLLYAVLDESWRFVVAKSVAQHSRLHKAIVYNSRTFPVEMTSPYAVREMTDFLKAGGKLVIFPEGRISITGGLMKLFDGTGFLLTHTGARTVTCYLRGAQRLPWVRHTGWTRWFPRVEAYFSDLQETPKFPGCSGARERTRLSSWLRDRLLAQQFEVEMEQGPANLLSALVEVASQIPGKKILEDVNRSPLSYRRLLLGTTLLSGRWSRLLHADDKGRVGVLLPNVAATPITLLSLWASGRIPAILNYTHGLETMLSCARLAGLRQIITSKTFIEKARINAAGLEKAGLELVYLEEVRESLSTGAKLLALLRHHLSASGGLGNNRIQASDTAVVLFTSGSEGEPKGVELSHANILANIRGGAGVIDLCDDDRFFNALPLFHSFGLTGGTLLPLLRGCYVFLYPTPLHYRIVPSLVYDRSCTVLLGTNTFLNGYARKAHPYDFCTLRLLVAGAEKVQSATLDTFARKFGVRILEGYGATECSPIISVNSRLEPCCGSAGRLLPGMEARLEPVEGVNEGGRLHVRGPNVMKGYLNPEANSRFQAAGGWYDTGDIVKIDEDGFLHIQGRLKRFAKISGEMVSLTAVEEALSGAFPQFGPRCTVAVLTKPDADKGERLVAVTNEPRLQLSDLREVLRSKGHPNLNMPRELHLLQPIPLLGTGKVDYRELARRLEKTASN